MAGLTAITLQDALNSTKNSNQPCMQVQYIGVHCANRQPKRMSNPKRTVNLQDQALQPDPRHNAEKSTWTQTAPMTVYHVTTVSAAQPQVDLKIPAQMMIVSHPLGIKRPFGDVVPQLLLDQNLSQESWVNNKSDSSHWLMEKQHWSPPWDQHPPEETGTPCLSCHKGLDQSTLTLPTLRDQFSKSLCLRRKGFREKRLQTLKE